MKKILFLCLFSGLSMVVFSQPADEASLQVNYPFTRLQLGFQLNQIQHDFGMGINVTSPRFFHRHVAIRLGANVQWLQYIAPASLETNWKTYGVYKLGVNGISGFITKSIMVYGEGGLVMMAPNKKFSDKSLISGGYGLFGFEFIINKHFSYFIELGGMGTGAIAEKSLYKTVYANGFTTSVGIRKSF